MKIHAIGTRFLDYPQYCAVVDDALASIHAPLMNGLPLAGDARRLIEARRLFYVRGKEYLLLFSAHVGYYKLYYAAHEDAALVIPPTVMPIVADQVQLAAKPCPRCEKLMTRGGFTLDRVDVRLERKLDASLRRSQYVHGSLPVHAEADYAMTGEYYKINTLLRSAFDPLLDELPGRDELTRSILDGFVFVVRDVEKIAAVMVCIPKGAMVMLHWIAVDIKYRNQNLSGLLHFFGDIQCRRKGFRQEALWVDEHSSGWIQAVLRRGFHLTDQRLLTYVHPPNCEKSSQA